MSFLLNPYSSFGGGGGGGVMFDATSIADCALWLKAYEGVFSDAGTTPAGNGDTVRQWSDFSGNNRHASQSSSGSRPTFNTGLKNGKPGITFDGNNDHFTLASTIPDSPVTVFAVIKPALTGTNKSLVGSSSTSGFQLRINSAEQKMEFVRSAVAVLATQTNAFTTTTYQVFEMDRDTGSGAFRLDNAANGTFGATASLNAIGVVGAANSGGGLPGEPYAGVLLELIIYARKLNSTDIGTVDAGLAANYAL